MYLLLLLLLLLLYCGWYGVATTAALVHEETEETYVYVEKTKTQKYKKV